MRRVAATMLALVLGGYLAAPCALAQAKPECKRFGFYRICGEARQVRQFDDLLDFGQARRRGHEAAVAEIRKVNPGATLTRLPLDHPLSRRWQTLASKYGSKRSLNDLDPMAVEAAKADPFQAFMLQAFRSNEIFLSVDLARFPDFLTVYDAPIGRFCNRFLDSQPKTYSVSMRRRAFEDCEKNATGNVASVSSADEDAQRMVYFMYLSLWGMELIAERLADHMKATPRVVYVVGAPVNASPRVTSLGDLYLPERFAAGADPVEAELVMLHEALHLQQGGLGSIAKLLLSYIPQAFATSESVKPEEFARAATALLRQQAFQEEFTVDAAVVVELYDRPRERRRYAELIKRMEVLYPERAEAIGLLNQLADSSQSASAIYALTVALGEGQKAPRGFTATQAAIYRQWLDVYQRYMASALTRLSQDLPNRERQDPIRMEREVTEAMRALFIEYQKLIESRRRK